MPPAQVRDMTGDGSVVKRRIKDGRGEFPVDCPIEDSSVRVHYRWMSRLPQAVSSQSQESKRLHFHAVLRHVVCCMLEPVYSAAAGSSNQSRGGRCWTPAARMVQLRRWSSRQASRRLFRHMSKPVMHSVMSAGQHRCTPVVSIGSHPEEVLHWEIGSSAAKLEGRKAECVGGLVHRLYRHDETS